MSTAVRNQGSQQKAYGGAAIVSNDDLRKMREDIEKGKGATRDAAILTQNDIARMKASTKIQSVQEKKDQAKIDQEMKQSKFASAAARKAKMQQLDKERANKVPATDIEQRERNKGQGLLAKAQQQMDEEHDDVKQMNQMVLYSKVVTIRDKQLDENKRLEEDWVNEQKRLDLMMEIERLKGLQISEQREHARVEAQRRGAAVIIDQIKDREVFRQKEREVLEREQAQMARAIELQKEQDAIAAVKKQERNKQMIAEVEAANRIAQVKKQEKIDQAKAEDNKIVEYNRQKAKKEEEAAIEAKRIAEEKEKEIQRLRELQEKAADRQGEIDALRAKRAYEEGERQARKNEMDKVVRQQMMAAELEQARKKQFLEKEVMYAEQAKAERDAFLKVIDRQKADEENEKRVEQQKQVAFKNHAKGIRDQIGKNDEGKKQERLDYLEEGRRVRQKLDDERVKVEGIKGQKIQGLQKLGIDNKYQADLSKKKIH